MKNKIHMDELKTFEESIFIDVTYKGQPFTGIAVDDTENFHSEYSYKNGKGHGICVSIYNCGNLMEKFELYHGKKIGDEFEWYESGVLKSQNNDSFYKLWDEDGILRKEVDHHNYIEKQYYETGEKGSEWYYGEGVFLYNFYTKSGYRICKPNGNEYIFNDTVIEKNFFELMEVYEFMHPIIEWLKIQIKENRSKAVDVIEELLKSDNLHIKERAIYLCREFKIIEMLNLLKAATNDNRLPPKYRSFDGLNICFSTRIISESAKYALEDMGNIL